MQLKNLSRLLQAVLCVLTALACAGTFASGQRSGAEEGSPAAIAGAEKVLSYSEDRPANFIFILDVSGSMLFPGERVKAQDGSLITLFEALRQALRQIVQDERLVTSGSKIAFITFGTTITEKSGWPTSPGTAQERSELLRRICSAEELQADRHGETYMAGGLSAAYKRAEEFAAASPPCTTTFIVMLTDGWDEPPAGASCTVADQAERFLNKQKELKKKLGVNTWQIRVVGLQQLPDRKAGTTTALELARMLGGEFIDVSKAQKGTVAERIYAAMKQTISDLRGQIDLPAPGTAENTVDFGRLAQSPHASGSFPVWNRSCYVEKITAVKDACAKVTPAALMQQQKLIEKLFARGNFHELPEQAKHLIAASQLPPGAITLRLDRPEFLLAPVEREGATAGEPSGKIAVTATAGAACPPGAFLGFMAFDSTAKVPGRLAYLLTVPSRLTVNQDAVKVQVRKPGFIFDKDTLTELNLQVGARVNSSYNGDFDAVVQAGPGAFSGRSIGNANKAVPLLAQKLIHNGEPLNIKVTSGEITCPVRLAVLIPADMEAGQYEGTITVKCREHNDLVSDTSVPYVIEVLPSPWDEMSPVAIPVLALLALVIAASIFMAIISNRSR